ncbi:MAG: serine/threonine phosphatase [Leptolyngbyaceae bacterium]|nr:serine/threonine phosphatase [Leptolyngbyaceae bacterium]
MIRCLQCEFENPDNHKFCQNCGSILQRANSHSTDAESPKEKALEVVERQPCQVSMDQGSMDEGSVNRPSHAEAFSLDLSSTTDPLDQPETKVPLEHPPSKIQREPFDSTVPFEVENGDIPHVEEKGAEESPVEFPASASSPEPSLEGTPPWLAILSLNDPLDAEFFDPAVVDLAAITDLLQQRAIALQERGYLDDNQRYRIGKCLLKTPEVHHSIIAPYLEISIFDEKPRELSQIDLLLNQSSTDTTEPCMEQDFNDVGDSEPSASTVFDADDSDVNLFEVSDSESKGSVTDDSDNSKTDGSESDISDSDASETAPVEATATQAERFAANLPVSLWEDPSGEGETDILAGSQNTDAFSNGEDGGDVKTVESEDDDFSENATVLEARRAASALESAQAIASFTPPGRSVESSKIPSLAAVYLTVQDEFYPSLPQIHDAWMTDDVSVIVVENRKVLQGLDDAIQMPQTTPLQVLHWFHEMTELWAVLQPRHYHQSLLDLENLHLDEDQILCITCLYRPSKQTEISLLALGELWQYLLHMSPLKSNEDLIQLSQNLATGDIDSIDDLRLRLEDVAIRLNDESFATPMGDGADPSALPPVNEASIDVLSQSSDLLIDLDDRSGNALGGDLGLFPEGDEAPTVVLPMRLFHLSDVGATDIGRQRDHNEDYFSVQSEMQKKDTPVGRKFSGRGLYILCDGMGGHAAGEVASALAVSTLESYFSEHWIDRFPSQDEIRDGIRKANNSIFELNQENACYGSGRMGTTLVMMLVDDIKVAIAHVGDSRVYKFCRRTGLEQITVDHEVGQREIQRGVEPAIAYARPDAYQLTQALGPRDSDYINPGIQALEVNEDTLFILCSDGLSDNNLLERFCDTHVEPMLSSQANLSHELSNLIELANQHNGHDNITAIAVRMKVRPKIQGLQ